MKIIIVIKTSCFAKRQIYSSLHILQILMLLKHKKCIATKFSFLGRWLLKCR